MYWHPIVPVCPTCNVFTSVYQACMNAEGKLQITGKCQKCKHHIECEVGPEEIIANCKELDAAASRGQIDLASFTQEGKVH